MTIDWIAETVGRDSWAMPWIQTGMICVQDLTREKNRAFELKDLTRPPARMDALGCGGWDDRGFLRHVGIDLDVGHGDAKQKYETTEAAIEAARAIRNFVGGAAEIRRSKSGVGIHVRIVIAGEIVNGRETGKSLGRAAYAAKWIAKALDIKRDPTVLGRQNLWFWARTPGARGFELVDAAAGAWSIPPAAMVEEIAPAPIAPPRPSAPAAPGTGMDDYRRAELYLSKASPVGSGGRNKALYELTFYLLERFRLSEAEILALALSWAYRCDPPMEEHEARETIRSAYRRAAGKNAIGSKWTAPKVAGARRPIDEPTGPEVEIDIPEGVDVDGALAYAGAGAPHDSISPLAEKTRPKAASFQSASAAVENDAPSAGGGEEQSANFDADGDSVFAEDTGDEDLAAERKEAQEYIDKDFEGELLGVSKLEGLMRDDSTIVLLKKLAKYLPFMATVTCARVKDKVCKSLDMGKADFNRAIREARALLNKSSNDEADWLGMARRFRDGLLVKDRALVRWRQDWYEWAASSGYYARKSDEWMKAQAVQFMGEQGIPVSSTAWSNFQTALIGQAFLDDDIRPGHWTCNIDGVLRRKDGCYVVMKNGILDIEFPERPLLPQSPDYWCINGMNYNFDPKAQCPKYMDAVAQWQGQTNGETYAMQLLQDWAGYCLEPGNREQKFLLCRGDGNDAKSTYSSIVRALVGEKNCAAVGLEAFDPKKNFGLWPLLGKTLNQTGDASDLDRISEGMIKSITGGDPVTIDRKNKDPITDVLPVKFMMNCNQMPMFKDQSEGIWRRMLVLDWKPIPEAKVIKDYHKVLIDEEISGIFNWALEGFHRVRKQGFTRQGVLITSMDAARASIQPEQSFFEESIGYDEAPDTTFRAFSDALVEAYRDYCTRHNVKAYLYEENLGKALKKWLRRRLMAGGMEESQISDRLENLKQRTSIKEVDSKKRKTYYKGIWIRFEKEDEKA